MMPVINTTNHSMKPTDFYTYAQTIASLNRETVTATVIEDLNPSAIAMVLSSFADSSHIAIDVETRGFEPYDGGLHGIGLSDGIRHYYIIPNSNVVALLEELNYRVTWVLHNAKFDMKWLEFYYKFTLSKVEDTMIAAYVLNPDRKLKLATLASEYLNRYPMDFSELVMRYSSEPLTTKKGGYYKEVEVTCSHCKGTGKERGKARVKGTKEWEVLEDMGEALWVEKIKDMGKELILEGELYKPKKCSKCNGAGHKLELEPVVPIDFLPLREVGNYCAEDCYETVKLWHLFKVMLVKEDLYSIYELERNVMPILKRMEVQGVHIDQQRLGEVKELLKSNVDFWGSEYQLYDANGNPSSPSQVAKALAAVGLMLESTDKASLQKVKDSHPLPEIILNYRKAEKLLQFATELDKPVIRTSYGYTVTGRLSSKNPNLQNIPAKSEEGSLIRQCFVASSPDKVILALDYSAFEYRIIAYQSNDPLLKQCFLEGKDFHGILTGMIFGYEWDFPSKKLTPKSCLQQREGVKSLNYGLAYGMGASKLSRMLQCSIEEAQDLMAQHRELVPDIWAYLHSSRESAIVNGYTKTIWGRKRYYTFNSPCLQGLTGDVPYNYLEHLMADKRISYEDMAQLRESMNHPIQGTNADAIKAAKIEVFKQVCIPYGTRLLLTVHDELVLETDKANADAVYRATKKIMEEVIDLGDIPVIVEGSIAQSWGLAK